MEQSAHKADRKIKIVRAAGKRGKGIIKIQVTQRRTKVRNTVKTLYGFYQTTEQSKNITGRNQGRYTYSVMHNDINNGGGEYTFNMMLRQLILD